MASKKTSIEFKRLGTPNSASSDFFHTILSMSWVKFFATFVFLYLLINAFFASLYFLGGESILNLEKNSFWEAFIFSFQTSTTIGYGHFLPANAYAHTIVIFDALSGILLSALTTGMAVVKFARPSSRVLFSENLLINKMDGEQNLSLRIGNARTSEIVDAKVNVVVAKMETTKEGIEMRRIYDLELKRNHSPLFVLSWTVMHVIDEKSPLYQMTPEELQSPEVNFIVSLTGIEEVFSQTVYDRYIYTGESVVYGTKFKDITGFLDSGERYLDYTKFDEIEK